MKFRMMCVFLPVCKLLAAQIRPGHELFSLYRNSSFFKISVVFLCGLHKVYSHIMYISDLFIYLSMRVECLSSGRPRMYVLLTYV